MTESDIRRFAWQSGDKIHVSLGETQAAQDEHNRFRNLVNEIEDDALRERVLDALARKKNGEAYGLLKSAGIKV